MEDIWNDLMKWSEEKRPFVIARVVQTWRSAPRKAGAAMLIDDKMNVVGSVSGGCIEGAVIEEAQTILQGGSATKLAYGIEDETAWSVGLACGGKIHVYLEKAWPNLEEASTLTVWDHLTKAVNAKKSVALLSDLENKTVSPMLVYEDGNTVEAWPHFDDGLKELCLEAIKSQNTQRIKQESGQLFCHVFPAPDRLIIVGAGHISLALLQLANQMNFETHILDPRKIFTTEDRFPVKPTKLYTEWPHEVLKDWSFNSNTYAVLLTHDPKIDDPVFELVLKQPIRYVGALGSRKTQEKRRQRLMESGLSEQEIDQIKGPIGLSIGAETPDEIALSIMAEIIQVKRMAAPKG